MIKPKILFICGSLNQTTMMHKISNELPEYDSYFTPYYATGFLNFLVIVKILDFTIMGGEFKRKTLEYLKNHNLKLDFRGKNDDYDLVITCQDLIIPSNITKFKTLLVQEGMTDPIDWRYHVTRFLHLPRWSASTSMTGLSHQYDVFCVASEGFKEQFIQRGINPDKICVTGIPNFDNFAEFNNYKFEHKNFVLVATSDTRETLKYENRKKLIRFALKIANNKKLIFKLHPNENVKKRIAEIKKYATDALVYHSTSIDPLLASCDVLITRYSSTIFAALALGKEIYCNVDIDEIKKLAPVQNAGKSASIIAEVAKELISKPMFEIRHAEKSTPIYEKYLDIKYLIKQKWAKAK